jgi:transposase-like protein
LGYCVGGNVGEQGDTFFIDEVFVKINGKQHYLWRAVDQGGEVVDVFLQARRDGVAAKRSSSDYCETTAVSLGKSLLTSLEVMV